MQKSKQLIYTGQIEHGTEEIGVLNNIPKRSGFRQIEEKSGVSKKDFFQCFHLGQTGTIIKGGKIVSVSEGWRNSLKGLVQQSCFYGIWYCIVKSPGKSLKAGNCNKALCRKLIIRKGERHLHMRRKKLTKFALHKSVAAKQDI